MDLFRKLNEESLVKRKEYDYLEMDYLREYEELINERQNYSANEISDKLKTELSLSYLYVISFASLALAVNQEGEKKLLLKNDWTDNGLGNPLLLLQNVFTHITNYSLAVIRMVEDGLDASARVILRALTELTWISIIICSDKEYMNAYLKCADVEEERKAWFKYFKPKKLLQGLSKVEKTLGIDEELLKLLDVTRSDVYSFYSKYLHNSYSSISVGAYSMSFSDEETLRFSLLGLSSKGSKGTLNYLLEVMFYSNLLLHAIFRQVHDFSIPVDSYLWKVHECFQKSSNESYLNYLNNYDK